MDDLFLIPFLAGLPLVLVLAWLGPLLRLRDEWLATLGLAHLAGAGGLAGLAAGLPTVLGAPLAALAGAGLKFRLAPRAGQGNSLYAAMILLGWTATLLIAANTPLGDALAHALVDGQLYFAGRGELAVAWGLLVLAGVVLPWLTPRLLRASLFPQFETANRLPAWHWHLGFDLLVALAVAVGTATLGLMGTFALVFLPAWVAFRRAGNWRRGTLVSLGLGLACYVAAFVLALALDQPFGPVLVAVLGGAAILAARVPARRG
ncbi:MAG: metal ABC transporter permease [Pseudomonadota bacterium]